MEQEHEIDIGTGGRVIDPLAERKADLLRQGQAYRVGIAHSRASVKESLRPQALMHRALDHATGAVRERVDGLWRPGGTKLSALMPFALTAFGFLRKRRLLRPALGAAAVVGSLGWYLRHRAERLQRY